MEGPKTTFHKFSLWRQDESGTVPGRGCVAEGCLFSSGIVVIAWLTQDRRVSVYESYRKMLTDPIFDGRTEIVPADIP